MWFFRRKHNTPPPRAIAPIVSKQRFQTVHGRRVVADIPYLLPKDLEEINRLDF